MTTTTPNNLTAGQTIKVDGHKDHNLYPQPGVMGAQAFAAYDASTMTGTAIIAQVTERQVTNTGGRTSRRIRVYDLTLVTGEVVRVTASAKLETA